MMLAMEQDPALSVVCPCFNEAPNLEPLYQRLRAVGESLALPWEIILVNNGSTDASAEIMARLHAQDPRLKFVSLSRNYGFQMSVTAGLDRARGQAVVVMDADLQDPPEVIPQMVAKWRDGYDVVYAIREVRQGETWLKRVTAAAFYRLLRRITDVQIPVDTGDFRLMSRRVVGHLRLFRERHRFIRGIVAWMGFRQTGIYYVREARQAGETKFSWRSLFRFAFDAITAFSFAPLRLATYLGFLISITCFLLALLTIVGKVTFGIDAPGWASLMVVILFIGGVQLVTTGLIGEYVGRIYDEVKQRPLYLVDESHGFDAGEAEATISPGAALRR